MSDTLDLSNHFVSADFTLSDHRFKRWEPSSSSAEHTVYLELLDPSEALIEFRSVPLEYPNLFGLDPMDEYNVNKVVEEMIKDHELE